MRYLILLFLATPALAECPAPPDHGPAMTTLMERIREAPDQRTARGISQQLWELWATAPDEAAQELLDEGMRRRASYDFLGAIEVLDRLVDYCPGYAEGWNQRAFARFLRQEYSEALVDLDQALALDPDHIAALAGKALTLIGLERNEEAQEVLRAAVALNPWLSERALLDEPEGEEI